MGLPWWLAVKPDISSGLIGCTLAFLLAAGGARGLVCFLMFPPKFLHFRYFRVNYFSRPATTQRKRMELWTLWRSGNIEGTLAHSLPALTPVPIILSSAAVVQGACQSAARTVGKCRFFMPLIILCIHTVARGAYNAMGSAQHSYSSNTQIIVRSRVRFCPCCGFSTGVFAMDIDELFLRQEPALQRYWNYRDHGDQEHARLEIEDNLSISNLVVRDTPNTRTHLQMRISDLLSLGCGGDSAEIYMAADRDSEDLDRDILQVCVCAKDVWSTVDLRDYLHGLQPLRATPLHTWCVCESVRVRVRVSECVHACMRLWVCRCVGVWAGGCLYACFRAYLCAHNSVSALHAMLSYKA